MNCSADTHAAAAGGEGAADSGGDCGDDGDGGGGAAPTGDDANNGQSKYVCPHVCVCVCFFCWGLWGYTLVFFCFSNYYFALSVHIRAIIRLNSTMNRIKLIAHI